MGRKKIGYGTHLVIYTLIVLSILTVINIIFLGKFYRIDLTENKIYSVSEATKKVLKKLDDVINITIYFSKEEKLPPQLIDLKRQITDLISEYTAYGGANITYKFIDPDEDEELSERMQFIGIPKVQVNIFQKDKAEVAAVYLGMSIMFEDRKEVIPVIQNVQNLEYDITSAILKVTKKEPEVIGFVTWLKEQIQQDPYMEIQRSLQKQYQVKNVSLSVGAEGLKDIDTLVILSPQEVTDIDKITLDQFLMRGGKLIYLIDMVRLKPGRQLETETVKTNITDLLGHYGFQIATDLVLDRSCSMAAFSGGGFFQFQLPYPFWPKVVKDGFDPNNPAVSKIETLTLPWTSSVRIKDKRIEEKGLKATILAQTTPHGWTQKGRFNLNPQQRFSMDQSSVERVPLAVMISGIFESYYAKGKPNDPNIGELPEDLQDTAEKESQVVVIGNSRFIQNEFLGRFPGNEIFFLNLVDWLTMGEELIGIRSREMTERPIPEISEKKKALIRYLNIFGISLLLILFGLIKFIVKRRKSSRGYEF